MILGQFKINYWLTIVPDLSIIPITISVAKSKEIIFLSSIINRKGVLQPLLVQLLSFKGVKWVLSGVGESCHLHQETDYYSLQSYWQQKTTLFCLLISTQLFEITLIR